MILELPLPQMRNQPQMPRPLDQLGHLPLILRAQSTLNPIHDLPPRSGVPPQQCQIIMMQRPFRQGFGMTSIHLPGRVEIRRQQVGEGVVANDVFVFRGGVAEGGAVESRVEVGQVEVGVEKVFGGIVGAGGEVVTMGEDVGVRSVEALEVVGVDVVLGAGVALEGVEFSFGEGSFHAVVGGAAGERGVPSDGAQSELLFANPAGDPLVLSVPFAQSVVASFVFLGGGFPSFLQTRDEFVALGIVVQF
mmetsp:Transcript_4423/g.8681  ORF Transcript_4423/g.8681 Transcript_4423/m.8681 type:complete len:248 (+) Transcript_4423:63-806(+)